MVLRQRLMEQMESRMQVEDEELRDLIRAFAAEGITVLVSSHILSEVQQMADRIGIIYRGRLAYEDELREGCDLEALFMDVCRRGAAADARLLSFRGDREQVRLQTVLAALEAFEGAIGD